MTKYTYISIIIACAACLFAACSSDEEAGPSEAVPFVIEVNEQGWNGEVISITRAGETLEGLKQVANVESPADGEGFGIYSYLLFLDDNQRQVIWNNGLGRWTLGKDWYWQRKDWGESTFNVYAYAPYKSTPYTFVEAPNSVSPEVDIASRSGLLTFNLNEDANNVDLLYAGCGVDDNKGKATLTFHHALAKLSFGIIANNTGADIGLSQISVTGNLYQSAKLNLMSGDWTETTAYEPASKTITRVIDSNPETDGNQPLTIAQANFGSIDVDPLLLIPGPEVTITLSMTDGAEFSFTTTLTKGQNQLFNITVNKNFEVVIN